MLPPAQTFARFLVASFVLAVTPGPGVVYIVTRTLAHGRRTGLRSVLGVALGNGANAVGAALGLTLLFSLWPVAFAGFTFAGALYLVALGVIGFRNPIRTSHEHRDARHETGPLAPARSSAFRSGLTVAVLNPKTALFFASFLPQFIARERNAMTQYLVLAAVFVVIAATTDSLYVLTSSFFARRWLARGGAARFGRVLASAVLVALGLFVALGYARPR